MRKYTVTVAERTFEIEVDHERLVRVDGRPVYVELEQIGGPPLYSLGFDDSGYLVFVEEGLEDYNVEVQGQVYPVQVQSQRPLLSAQQVDCADDGGDCLAVAAPLAGFLALLPVVAGDRVEAGQVVAIVESMKMQMELKAPRSGVVERLHGPPGRDVSQGEQLLTLRAE